MSDLENTLKFQKITPIRKLAAEAYKFIGAYKEMVITVDNIITLRNTDTLEPIKQYAIKNVVIAADIYNNILFVCTSQDKLVLVDLNSFEIVVFKILGLKDIKIGYETLIIKRNDGAIVYKIKSKDIVIYEEVIKILKDTIVKKDMIINAKTGIEYENQKFVVNNNHLVLVNDSEIVTQKGVFSNESKQDILFHTFSEFVVMIEKSKSSFLLVADDVIELNEERNNLSCETDSEVNFIPIKYLFGHSDCLYLVDEEYNFIKYVVVGTDIKAQEELNFKELNELAIEKEIVGNSVIEEMAAASKVETLIMENIKIDGKTEEDKEKTISDFYKNEKFSFLKKEKDDDKDDLKVKDDEFKLKDKTARKIEKIHEMIDVLEKSNKTKRCSKDVENLKDVALDNQNLKSSFFHDRDLSLCENEEEKWLNDLKIENKEEKQQEKSVIDLLTNGLANLKDIGVQKDNKPKELYNPTNPKTVQEENNPFIGTKIDDIIIKNKEESENDVTNIFGNKGSITKTAGMGLFGTRINENKDKTNSLFSMNAFKPENLNTSKMFVDKNILTSKSDKGNNIVSKKEINPFMDIRNNIQSIKVRKWERNLLHYFETPSFYGNNQEVYSKIRQLKIIMEDIEKETFINNLELSLELLNRKCDEVTNVNTRFIKSTINFIDTKLIKDCNAVRPVVYYSPIINDCETNSVYQRRREELFIKLEEKKSMNVDKIKETELLGKKEELNLGSENLDKIMELNKVHDNGVGHTGNLFGQDCYNLFNGGIVQTNLIKNVQPEIKTDDKVMNNVELGAVSLMDKFKKKAGSFLGNQK